MKNKYLSKITKSIASAASLTLLLTLLSPTIAIADPIETVTDIPITITAKKSSEYVGDTNSPSITFTTPKLPSGSTKKYAYIHIFNLGTGEYLTSCDGSRTSSQGLSCETAINPKDIDPTPVGVNEFRAFAEYYTEHQGFNKENPESLEDLANVEEKSEIIEYIRKPYALSLTTESPIFAAAWQKSTINAKLNQELNASGLNLYVFDMTTGLNVDTIGLASWASAYPYFASGNPHNYQGFVAKIPKDSNDEFITVTTLAQLKEIYATSNQISLTRAQWKVNIGAFYDVGISIDVTVGGGYYTTYLVDNATGNITWTAKDTDGLAGFAGFNGHVDEDGNGTDDWATAYVARSWLIEEEGNGIKPTNLSQLQDIQANSHGYSASTGTAISDPKEIAGGYNPSEFCSQVCEGDPINMATGEFFDNKVDLTVPGSGIVPLVNRAYSTTNKDILSSMGYGWSGNYNMALKASDNQVVIQQENGSIVTFNKDLNGIYKTAQKTMGTLEFINNQFVFIRNRNITFIFDTSGKLVQQKDRYANTINLSYNGAKINQVTDALGNTLSYTYTGDLLTKVSDNLGQTVTYGYNTAKKLLTSVVDSNGVSFAYTYDTQNRVKTLTNPLGGVTTNTFDAENRVTQQKDPLGRLLKFSYSGETLNQTVIITQPNGVKSSQKYLFGQLIERIENLDKPVSLSTHYSYNMSNQITSVVYPNGAFSQLDYDVKGNIKESKDTSGNVTKFTYDDSNNVITVTDAVGNKVVNSYDGNGNLLTSKNPLEQTTSFTYNSNGSLASSTDTRGNATGANPSDYTTIHNYVKGVLKETINPLGEKKINTFNSLGQVISTKDMLGNTTTIDYNALNIPSKIIDALLNETHLTYDKMGNTLTSKDSLGNVTTYTYDLLGNLLTAKNALNQVITYHYDSVNRIDNVTDANGKISKFEYDAFNRLTKTTDSLGRVAKQEWDAGGNMVTAIDPGNNKTHYSYDLSGNVTHIKDALGNTTKYYYNALNQVIKVVDAENRITQDEYDALGRVTKTTHADKTTDLTVYDSMSNVISKTNKEGKTQTWEYDSLNRKTKFTNETNQVTSYNYDTTSKLSTVVRPDNSIVKYEYDKLRILKKIDYPDTSSDVTYTHDVLGRISTEKIGNSPVTSYTYDAIGQLTSRGPPNSQVTYVYGLTGKTNSITYPSGRVVNYVYNDTGGLTSFDTQNVGNVSYEYDTRGLNSIINLPNGVKENNSYDLIARATGKNILQGENSLYKRDIKYSNTSEIIERNTVNNGQPAEIEKYKYDPLTRLTEKSTNGQVANNYTYSATGNILDYSASQQTFDNEGKLLSSAGKTLEYDALGNRTALVNAINTHDEEYTWSPNNSLLSFKKNDETVSYSYDSKDLLETRTINGETANFVWDGSVSNPLLLSDGEYEYVYGNSRVPVAQIKLSNNEVTYLHTDLNGSVTTATGINGAVIGSAEYSPYGKLITSPISRFGYAGEWTDPTTQETYLRARWVDTDTGVFLSRDPIVQSTSNAYRYTDGNPLTQIDPSGLCWTFQTVFNLASDCYKFADSNQFQAVSDAAAGAGDGITFGLTTKLNNAIGSGNVINEKSAAFATGDAAGNVASLLVPGGGAVKGAVGATKIGLKIGESGDTANDLIDAVSDSNSVACTPISAPAAESYLPSWYVKRDDISLGEGVIYYRYDKKGLVAPYVGQSMNEETYKARQKAHSDENKGSEFHFEVIVRTDTPSNNPNKNRKLRWEEEKAIQALGGLSKDGGLLSNKIHAMTEVNYKYWTGIYG